MAGHTRRFNPSHQWIHKKIKAGELTIQQMDVQTYFFRRTNMNAPGKPRSWTDHLLWHHACHTVDLFQYQTGETRLGRARDLQGRSTRRSRSRWTWASSMKVPVGRDLHAVAVVQQRRAARHVLPLHLRQRHLPRLLRRSAATARTTRSTCPSVDVSMNGIELQDREFFAAIKEKREPNSSVAQMLPGDADARPARTDAGRLNRRGAAQRRRLCAELRQQPGNVFLRQLSARRRGVSPLLSLAPAAAPQSSNACAIPMNPRLAAICSGVARVTPPSAFTSPPACTSARTISGPASDPHSFATR